MTWQTLLANADAFIHPNPREPFGIAPLEAMASGLPLVAPSSGGVMSYATEESAWLAPPDPENYARRIQEIFAHPDVRAQKRSGRSTSRVATNGNGLPISFLTPTDSSCGVRSARDARAAQRLAVDGSVLDTHRED